MVQRQWVGAGVEYYRDGNDGHFFIRFFLLFFCVIGVKERWCYSFIHLTLVYQGMELQIVVDVSVCIYGDVVEDVDGTVVVDVDETCVVGYMKINEHLSHSD